MLAERSGNEAAGVSRGIGRDELEATIARSAIGPAQGGSASAAPRLGLIGSVQAYNRYLVQLATDAGPGQPPSPIAGQQVVAINLAEPFDAAGKLQADTPVLVWPSQGLYALFCPPPPDQSPPPPPTPTATDGYWATIASGGGPGYTVSPQGGGASVSAVNVWELTVDASPSAPVPVGAMVRVWAEADGAGQTQRFFFYQIHSVYR